MATRRIVHFILVFCAAVSVRADTVVFNFAGWKQGVLETGPNAFFQTLNSQSQAFSRSPAAPIGSAATDAQILQNAGSSASVTTSNPTGTWKGVSFTSNAGSDDQSLPSLDHNRVYVGLKGFASATGAPAGVNVPKGGLRPATPTPINRTESDNAPSGFGIGPDSALNLAPALSGGIQIPARGVGTPFAPQQPVGSTLNAGDARFNTIPVQFRNLVYLVHIVDSGTGGNQAMLDWNIVDITKPNAPVPVSVGQIPDSSFAYFHGSIPAQTKGDSVSNRSGGAAQGPAGDVSTYYQMCQLNGLLCGSPASIDQSSVSEDGQTSGGTVNRWADYSPTILDPIDPNRFRIIIEIPLGNPWDSEDAQNNVAPEPGTFVLLGLGGLALYSLRRARAGSIRAARRAGR